MIETHDRIVGRTYRTAERTCQERIADEKAAVRQALRSFIELGSALIGARDAQTSLDTAVADGPGWEGLGALVATASVLAETIASDPLEHVLAGYARFRRYTPRMLRTLEIEPSPAARPLLESVHALREGSDAQPAGFPRPNSKWARLLRARSDHRLWETAVLFHLRDAFRSGDVWLTRSRRYGDIRQELLPASTRSPMPDRRRFQPTPTNGSRIAGPRSTTGCSAWALRHATK